MTKPLDPVALRIGRAYKRGHADLVEAGKLLLGVKKTLKHGEWLPWLRENSSALGFKSDRTAQRLIGLAKNPSSTSDVWGNGNRGNSPQHLFMTVENIDRVKAVMGDIDTDPSSCKEANAKYVKAKVFYDEAQDGLKQRWFGRVLLNPMYDAENLYPFADKLIAELENGNCTEAITVTPNSTDTDWCQKLMRRADAVCFHQGRVKFHAPGTGKTGNPALGTLICYFGPNVQKFVAVFGEVGFAFAL